MKMLILAAAAPFAMAITVVSAVPAQAASAGGMAPAPPSGETLASAELAREYLNAGCGRFVRGGVASAEACRAAVSTRAAGAQPPLTHFAYNQPARLCFACTNDEALGRTDDAGTSIYRLGLPAAARPAGAHGGGADSRAAGQRDGASKGSAAPQLAQARAAAPSQFPGPASAPAPAGSDDVRGSGLAVATAPAHAPLPAARLTPALEASKCGSFVASGVDSAERCASTVSTLPGRASPLIAWSDLSGFCFRCSEAEAASPLAPEPSYAIFRIAPASLEAPLRTPELQSPLPAHAPAPEGDRGSGAAGIGDGSSGAGLRPSSAARSSMHAAPTPTRAPDKSARLLFAGAGCGSFERAGVLSAAECAAGMPESVPAVAFSAASGGLCFSCNGEELAARKASAGFDIYAASQELPAGGRAGPIAAPDARSISPPLPPAPPPPPPEPVIPFTNAFCGSRRYPTSTGVESAEECARAVVDASRDAPYAPHAFAWSEAMQYCYACSYEQFAAHVPDNQHDIYSTAAYVGPDVLVEARPPPADASAEERFELLSASTTCTQDALLLGR